MSVKDQNETLSKSSVDQGLHAVDCNYTRCQRQFKYIPCLSETLALWLRLPEVLWQRPNVTNIVRKDADNLRASSQGFFFLQCSCVDRYTIEDLQGYGMAVTFLVAMRTSSQIITRASTRTKITSVSDRVHPFVISATCPMRNM